jgi:hypothetical protein
MAYIVTCALSTARRRIRLIQDKAKSLCLKETWKGTLRQVFIYLRSPPILGFCLGVVNQFLGSVVLPLPPHATDNIQRLIFSGGGGEF